MPKSPKSPSSPKCKTGACGSSNLGYILIAFVIIGVILLVWWYIKDSDRPEGYEDDLLYQNVYKASDSRPDHPVLRYQREASNMTWPANWGDAIRPLQTSGPAYEGTPGSGVEQVHSGYKRAYAPSGIITSIDGSGPFVGRPIGVPVRNSDLKETNEIYRGPFYPRYMGVDQRMDMGNVGDGMGNVVRYPRVDDLRRLERPLQSSDYFRPYGPNETQNISISDTPFYRRPEGPPSQFFGSADAYYPFPEVNTPWEKIGILTTVNPSEDTILNLFRRPIAPLQDLFEYTTQDKNGFVIPLERRSLIENDDIIERVRGYENKGPWRANIFVNNKFIWV